MKLRLTLGGLLILWAGACGTADHPGGPTATETSLVAYTSCDALAADLREMIAQEVEAQFDQERYWRRHAGGLTADHADQAEPTAPGPGPQPREAGKDYSTTNVQTEGPWNPSDEADSVKTDGHRIYLVNGNRLHIFGVPQPGALDPESSLELEGRPTELLLDERSGRVAVFSMIDVTSLPAAHPLRARLGEPDPRGSWLWRVAEVSKITVVDTAGGGEPTVVRELYLEGRYQTARLEWGPTGAAIRVGAWSYLNISGVHGYTAADAAGDPLSIDQREAGARAAVGGLGLGELVPRFYERLPDRTFTTRELTGDACRSFHRPTDSQGRGLTWIVSLDLTGGAPGYSAEAVVTNWSSLHATADRIYVAEPTHDWWWYWWNEGDDDATNVHAFDVSTPGTATYVGSGRVIGRLENGYGLDAAAGRLRIATTNGFGRWWIGPGEAPAIESHVTVLAEAGGRLATAGHLGGLARTWRVFATRFDGDRAYLATGSTTEPLVAVDLSAPSAPRLVDPVRGAGIATVLHPLGDGRLLSLGWGGGAASVSWQPQVSLYDASDEAHPALLDSQPLAGGAPFAFTQALFEPKAFQYSPQRGLLAVPVSSATSSGDPQAPVYDYSSHLVLISVDAAGLSPRGDIDHSRFYNSARDREWLQTDVRRAFFMGDFLYAFSDRGVTVHELAGLGLVAEQTLPGTTPSALYWWW